jgi:hypothetical protein
MAADHLLNATNIGLVGLAQTGIEYIPAWPVHRFNTKIYI